LREDFLFGVGESSEAPGEGGDLREEGFLEDGFGLEFFVKLVFECRWRCIRRGGWILRGRGGWRGRRGGRV
jgi:hypothetical protein